MADGLPRIEIGPEHECRPGLIPEVREIVIEQRSLAHPRFRNQREESPIAFRTVDQRGQSLSMFWSKVQKARVRSHPERLLCEFVVIQEHSKTYAAFLGMVARTGIFRVFITSSGVRKDGSKYSATNAAATATTIAAKKPRNMISHGLCAGSMGTTAGTAIATLAIRFWSSASEVRSCSRLFRYSK